MKLFGIYAGIVFTSLLVSHADCLQVQVEVMTEQMALTEAVAMLLMMQTRPCQLLVLASSGQHADPHQSTKHFRGEPVASRGARKAGRLGQKDIECFYPTASDVCRRTATVIARARKWFPFSV